MADGSVATLGAQAFQARVQHCDEIEIRLYEIKALAGLPQERIKDVEADPNWGVLSAISRLAQDAMDHLDRCRAHEQHRPQ